MIGTQQLRNRIKLIVAAVAAVIMIAAICRTVVTASPVNGREVSLYVNVEKDNKLIKGLNEANFRLYEDGQSRSFRLEPSETPMTIALLLEYGGNYTLFHDDLDALMQAFMEKAPDGNWYALATFSHDLTVNVDFTKQVGRLTAAYSALEPPSWNENDTLDAVYSMLDKMGRLPGRRVLIVAGSGLDSYSSHTLDDVKKKLESADVTIYAIGLGSALRGMYEPYLGSSQRLDLLQAESFLRMLASDSGGEAWLPNQEGAYPDVMNGIVQDLTTQYHLVYESQAPHDGKLHKIKLDAFQVVDDKRSDYKVRVRSGWRF